MERRGSVLDRRSWKDRRTNVMFLSYFWDGGIEKRFWKERREDGERRTGWIRVGPWYSIYPWDFKRPVIGSQLSVISESGEKGDF
jgi:hypothetical protein